MAEIVHDSTPAGLAFSQTGRGPDVVLVHGALVTREDMVMALFDALSEDFRLTAFDRPGHGDSAPAPGGSPWEQATLLHEGVRALGLQRPVIVGHSMGGAVALAYAAQFPRALRGAVALAPICFPELRLEHLIFGPRATPGLGPPLAQALSLGLDPLLLPILWRAMFLPQPMPERFAAAFPFGEAGRPQATWVEGADAAWLNLGLLRTIGALSQARAPIAILGGGRDLVVNNRLHGAVLARLLPNGRYSELEGLGHMLHHFAQPRVREAVEALAHT